MPKPMNTTVTLMTDKQGKLSTITIRIAGAQPQGRDYDLTKRSQSYKPQDDPTLHFYDVAVSDVLRSHYRTQEVEPCLSDNSNDEDM